MKGFYQFLPIPPKSSTSNQEDKGRFPSYNHIIHPTVYIAIKGSTHPFVVYRISSCRTYQKRPPNSHLSSMAGGGRLLVYCSISLGSWWCHYRILSGQYCRQDRHRTGRSLWSHSGQCHWSLPISLAPLAASQPSGAVYKLSFSL